MTVSIYLVDASLPFLKAVNGFLQRLPDANVLGQSTRGCDAIRQIAAAKPDLVLIDIGLPDMCGLDVGQTLRTWTQPPQIIFLSIFESDAYVHTARKLGAIGFINKSDFVEQLPPLLATLAALAPHGTCQ